MKRDRDWRQSRSKVRTDITSEIVTDAESKRTAQDRATVVRSGYARVSLGQTVTVIEIVCADANEQSAIELRVNSGIELGIAIEPHRISKIAPPLADKRGGAVDGDIGVAQIDRIASI